MDKHSVHFDANSVLSLPYIQPCPLHLKGHIQAGEIVALTGPSGCGKSSLLQSLAQVHELANVTYQIGDQLTSSQAAHLLPIGLCFQEPLLFNHLNVLDNLCFPLRFKAPYKQWSDHMRKERALSYLSELQIKELATRSVSELSGGEAQRVALLRSVIATPQFLLLDEALNALDKENKKRIQIWLKNLIQTEKIPTLLVTHLEDDISDFADRSVSWPVASDTLLF